MKDAVIRARKTMAREKLWGAFIAIFSLFPKD